MIFFSNVEEEELLGYGICVDCEIEELEEFHEAIDDYEDDHFDTDSVSEDDEIWPEKDSEEVWIDDDPWELRNREEEWEWD